MKQEIERKYTVKFFPENLKIIDILNIEQAFIYRDKKTVIRVRKIQNNTSNVENNGIQYIYTVKTKGDLDSYKKSDIARVYEIESNIQASEYKELIKNKISDIIRKIRMIVSIQNNLNVEIDIYKDYLQDFITAEVEFPNENIANSFEKPEWLGEEIGYKTLSNWKLSNMTKEEWQSKVTKETLENNRKIIQDLKKNKIIE